MNLYHSSAFASNAFRSRTWRGYIGPWPTNTVLHGQSVLAVRQKIETLDAAHNQNLSADSRNQSALDVSDRNSGASVRNPNSASAPRR